jgi:heme-degrading monooxygenase HmoA
MTAVERKQSLEVKSASRRSKRSRAKLRFLVIWRFQVRAAMEKRFEKVYGSKGAWVRLFAQDDAYITTELVREPNSTSYLTLDFWMSRAAYDAFRKQHRAEYKAIDLMCEGMTENEHEVGTFVRVNSGRLVRKGRQ